MKFTPQPPDTWQRVWMRCCITASLTCVASQLWASNQHWVIRSAMQETPRTIGVLCGVITILSTFGWFQKDNGLRFWVWLQDCSQHL
jgi:hypothetical protein